MHQKLALERAAHVLELLIFKDPPLPPWPIIGDQQLDLRAVSVRLSDDTVKTPCIVEVGAGGFAFQSTGSQNGIGKVASASILE